MIFKPTDRERAIKFIDKLFEKSKFIRIEHVPETKSLNQIRYVWLIFTIIADETGSDKNYIYHLFLNRFPTLQEIKNEFGAMELIPITMSLFSKEQMSNFIENVVIEGRSHGFDLPEPEDLRALEMYNYYRSRGIL